MGIIANGKLLSSVFLHFVGIFLLKFAFLHLMEKTMTITPASRSDGNSCKETQLSLFNYYDIHKIKFALMANLGNAQIMGSVKQLTALAYLMQQTYLNGGQIKVALEYIALCCKVSPASARRAVNYAIENKLIDVVNNFCGNIQTANYYILTKKSKKMLDNYYRESEVKSQPAAESNLIHRYNNLNLNNNYKSEVSKVDNTDFLISQEKLIEATIDQCSEIKEAILIAPLDAMAQELGIKQADLTRAMVHNPKLSLLCLISVYWYNKFGSRKIEKPSAFFAWLRWKATKAQQQEFLIKGFNCFNLREDLNQYREARKLKDIDNKNNDHHKICALTAPDDIRQFVQDSPPPLDARIARQFRLIKSQFLYNLGIDKSKKFHEIKPLGMVNGCLILRASADEILIFSRIYQEFLHKFQSENKQIKSIKFIKTGGKND